MKEPRVLLQRLTVSDITNIRDEIENGYSIMITDPPRYVIF